MNTSKITWVWGTAYDLFSSIRVLHDPGHYGLRPAWAAGVRSRVPGEHRPILEEVQTFLFVPRQWILSLPMPRDGATALWYLGKLPPEQRLLTLLEGGGTPRKVLELFGQVAERGSYTPTDEEDLREAYHSVKNIPRLKNLSLMLDLFSQATDSGERYLSALKAYHRVFFAEEEIRILPFLKGAVVNGEKMAAQLPLDDLIESLSRGVRLSVEQGVSEWVFVPSYWISPLVSFDRLSDERAIFMFGCRPPEVALVPGEVVPEGMLRAFKALGDSTRLRILRYLSQEKITPAEISRRLRLRAPTVTHHLNVLRLAGLVYLTLDEDNERQYTARMDTIDELFASLRVFFGGPPEDNDQNE
jgi:DNA-binding transcriptional ArsR family regulator